MSESDRPRFDLCPDCGGLQAVECSSVYPGACENDDCDGECLVPCPRCTGEGMVELVE